MLSAKLKEAAGNSADATLYVDDVFSTWLYTGNGSTQTITNGIDLAGKGGLVWVKSRSAATDHKLTDTVRGATKALISDTTGAETTDSTGLTAFSSTGFSLGANSVYNTNAATYASWTFREAAKFFDVVTYTGTGSARTIAHSLGVAPGMVIVKRTDTTGNWQVYHRSLTSAAYSIQLNLTNAQASAPTVWNSTAPTSSVFSVGTDATVNASGGTYVAYLFAHDTSSTGIIQCGSFTTDGSGNATVNLGWEPQYLMLKRTDTTSPWYLIDTMRGWDKSIFNWLSANSAGSTSTTNVYAGSPTATGFVVGDGSGQFPTNATYIYMAIRMPNKPPTTGTQVYTPNLGNNLASAGLIYNSNSVVDLLLSHDITSGGSGYAQDRLRGAPQYVQTIDDSSELTASSWGLASNVGVTYNTSRNLTDRVGWMFTRAPGFFDEVCYTGTGSATTQAHNLTVVPELILVKERSAANDWWVYVSSVGNTKYSVLNSTAIPTTSSTAWNNTTPTASVFSIGTGSNVNASAQTFVAYLFATLAGISKVGSYTGNGTGQAIACGFGSGGARFVLIKRTDSTGSWYTFDSARGLTSGSSPYLLLDSAAAEVTGNNGVYASSGGFTLGATAITTTNIATATYIFLAVA
jgi:hypothetical protein